MYSSNPVQCIAQIGKPRAPRKAITVGGRRLFNINKNRVRRSQTYNTIQTSVSLDVQQTRISSVNHKIATNLIKFYPQRIIT
jgi:hypothetical protein